MKHITLTIADISRLNKIQCELENKEILSENNMDYLVKILSQVPKLDALLLDKIPLDTIFDIKLCNQQEEVLKQWQELFSGTPGWDYTGFAYFVVEEDKEMLDKNVIMIAQFAPSMSHNLNESKHGYEVWLKDDGTALFWLPTLEDTETYPELYNFKGSWKEAYLLLIETLKKGWPMEAFPAELQQFLKK